MAVFVLMPQKGISEESAVLSAWHVKKGDQVKTGDIIFSLETGKAAFDVEAEQSGEILELLCAEGDELLIKAPVCVIGSKGDKYDLPAGAPAAKEAPPAPETEKAMPSSQPAPSVSAAASGAASPRARNLAAKTGIDIANVAPSGPEGRVIERDVNAYLNSGRAVSGETPRKEAKTPGAVTEKPISRIRKLIAENMHKSLSGTAQLTLNASFDATAILALRKSMKADKSGKLSGVTLNDMILFAVSRTLPAFPDLNAHFTGDTMKYFSDVNLAFACDNDKGLMVPVILGADGMSLTEISAAAKALASSVADGSIGADKLGGGSFTVSNLGTFGVESFTPVINPPQTGILGVNTLITRVRETEKGIEAYQSMPLSLTFDHRALDGAPAARFLSALCKNLENFPLLLI